MLAVNKSTVLTFKFFVSSRIGIVEIAEEDSIDIDSPFDLQVAEMLLQYKTSKPSVNSSQ